MKRSSLSARSQKWVNRYSLDNHLCIENVLSMCEVIFEFTTFKITNYKGISSLWLTYGTKSYIAFVSKENVCIEVLESNKNNLDNKYHKIDKYFFGDNCWYELLLWIKNRI